MRGAFNAARHRVRGAWTSRPNSGWRVTEKSLLHLQAMRMEAPHSMRMLQDCAGSPRASIWESLIPQENASGGLCTPISE